MIKKTVLLFILGIGMVFGSTENRTSLHSDISTILATSKSGGITAADVRQITNSLVDSSYNIVDDGTPITFKGDTTTQVASIGDSLTMLGYYQAALQSDLGLKWQVLNWGVGGEFSSDGAARFATWIVNQGNAKYVIVFYGINNIRLGQNATDVQPDLQSMYDAAHAAGIKVIAVTLTPFGLDTTDWTSTKETQRNLLNAWIRAIPTNVDFIVDADLILRDPAAHQNYLAAYNADGLHYNLAGGTALGHGIYSAVTWIFSTSSKSFQANGFAIDQSLHWGSSPTFRTLNLLPGGPYAVPIIIPKAESLIASAIHGAIENDGVSPYYTDDTGQRRRITVSGQDLYTTSSPNFYGITARNILAASVSSTFAINFSGFLTTGQSNGIFGNAGTNASDTAFALVNYAQTKTLLKVRGDGDIQVNKQINAPGVVGDQTINATAGRFNIAAGGTSVAITNSLVTTSSIITGTVSSNDLTMKSVQIIPQGGYFLCYGNAAATVETPISFIIVN